MTKESTERNKELYFKHKQGASIGQLSKEYNLSRSRVHQILNYVREELRKPPIEIPEIKEACRLCDSYDNIYRRIVNRIQKAGLHKRNAWKTASVYELRNVDGLGKELVDIILMAQTIENRR